MASRSAPAERGQRAGQRVTPSGGRIGAEHVAVVAIADVGDRLAGHEVRGPELLVGHVVHEGAHVPVGAGRRRRPRRAVRRH